MTRKELVKLNIRKLEKDIRRFEVDFWQIQDTIESYADYMVPERLLVQQDYILEELSRTRRELKEFRLILKQCEDCNIC